MVQVTCDFDLTSAPYKESLYAQLINEMLVGQPTVQQVVLRALPDGHSGLSGVSVLLAYRFGAEGSSLNPWLVRVGTIAALANEQQRYTDFVSNRIGRNRAEQRHEHKLQEQGVAIVAYDYLHQGNRPLQTLRNFLGEDDDLPLAAQAVRNLFVETICQHGQSSGWYNDCRLYKNQRPLWFYNTMLPPTLVLDAVVVRPDLTEIDQLTRTLEQADSSTHHALLGQTILIPLAMLSIDEIVVKAGQLSMRVLIQRASADSSDGIYQPLRPLDARIELIMAEAERHQVEAAIESGAGAIAGRIAATRFGFLERFRERLNKGRFGQQVNRAGIANPLYVYQALLAKPQPLHTSIIHGDMNLSNILLSRTEQQSDFTAWLIDFDKTDTGGHTLFDAVKLETEYKVHILPHRLSSIDDFIILDKALHLALVQPEQAVAMLGENRRLIEAYNFLATVRRMALVDLFSPDAERTRPSAEEYYLGLLAYGLTALKYPNLYDDRSTRWLSSEACLNHIAVAAYLSASSAAIELTSRHADESWQAHTGSYPPALRPQRQVRVRKLVGREQLLTEARYMLGIRGDQRPAQRIIALYGQPGSGRDAMALTLLADLEDLHYQPLIWPPIGQQPTVEGLVEAVQKQLNLPFDAPSSRSPSSIGLGSLPEQLAAYQAYLRRVLEEGEGNQPRALLLQLQQADGSLLAFVARLCDFVRRSAVLVVADQVLPGMPAGSSLEVPFLALDHVRTYIRDNQQLSLDEAGVTHLWQACQGSPRLMVELVSAARQHQARYRGTFQEALMSISTSDQVPREFMREIFQRFSAYGRYLTAIEAALYEQRLEGSLKAEQVFEAIGPKLGYPSKPDTATVLLSAQYVEQQRALLYEVALADLLLDQRRGLYYALADHCRQELHQRSHLRELPYLYIVAYYYTQADAWQEAANALAELRAQRELVLTSHCQKIYALVKTVLDHGELLTNETELVELAGDCATYLCLYSEATDYYQRMLGLTASPLLLARLIKLFNHDKQFEQAAMYAEQLIAITADDEPLNALGRAYSVADLRQTDPDRAAAILLEVLERYHQTQANWGAEGAFFAEEQVAIYDILARVAVARNQIDEAVKHLLKAFDIARKQKLPPPLAAQIESTLGYVYYFERGTPIDIDMARTMFERALKTRTLYDDRRGMLITGLNLANLRHRHAINRADFDAVDEQFQASEQIAEELELSYGDYAIASHMDLLIHRGEFARARELYARVDFNAIMFDETRLLLWLNRAKLALWEGDRADCAIYLDQITTLLEQTDEEINQIEWAQLTLEAHLRLGLPLNQKIVRWVEAHAVQDRKRPEELAEWRFAQGLLALAQSQPTETQAHFTESAKQWARLKSYFRRAVVICWQANAYLLAGQHEAAQQQATFAAQQLAPFGSSAPQRWLLTLQAAIDGNVGSAPA